MGRAKTWDPDWIPRAEARHILDVTDHVLALLITEGQVSQADRPSRRFSRAEVTALASQRANLIDTTEVAAILGVNRSRVGQLVDAGLLPCEHIGRLRQFRRAQVAVIANARRVRWHAHTAPDVSGEGSVGPSR